MVETGEEAERESINKQGKRLNKLTHLVHELAQSQSRRGDYLEPENQQMLDELIKQSSVKSFKERSLMAISSCGLKSSDDDKSFKPAPALCNPQQIQEDDKLHFPLTESVSSRILNIWRTTCGTKKWEESWDPKSNLPPPGPIKFGKGIPRPRTDADQYKTCNNSAYCESGLYVDSALQVAAQAQIPIAMSRLADWEKGLTSMLSMANMIDIYSTSINKDMDRMMEALDQFELPPEAQDIVDNYEKTKADCKSRAKGLQAMTDTIAWLYAENVMLKRDFLLSKSKLSENSKQVLRLQPFAGPYLFGGRADELIKKDAKTHQAKQALKWNQSATSYPAPTSTQTSSSTYTNKKPKLQKKQLFRKKKVKPDFKRKPANRGPRSQNNTAAPGSTTQAKSI